MNSKELVTVNVLAFGPIAEQLGGRNTSVSVEKGTSVEALVKHLELASWLEFGLSVSINGHRVPVDTPLEGGEEVALLPPVSGG